MTALEPNAEEVWRYQKERPTALASAAISLKRIADVLEREHTPRDEAVESFRRQLAWQLEQFKFGNTSADGTTEFILDLIGGTRVAAVDVVLAEEVRKLRLEVGHLQYALGRYKQGSSP